MRWRSRNKAADVNGGLPAPDGVRSSTADAVGGFIERIERGSPGRRPNEAW
jgi:hypothetical protein